MPQTLPGASCILEAVSIFLMASVTLPAISFHTDCTTKVAQKPSFLNETGSDTDRSVKKNSPGSVGLFGRVVASQLISCNPERGRTLLDALKTIGKPGHQLSGLQAVHVLRHLISRH